MSTLKTTNLQHPSAASPAIVLDAAGNMVPAKGYLYQQTVYFTSSGTFTKATYPWLRAIRVKVQGAGGGGGGVATTGAGQSAVASGGTGGVYAESFITDISSLSASVTVTVGAGGAGGAAGNNNGVTGGASSFGTAVVGNAGSGGGGAPADSNPNIVGATITTNGGTGDLIIPGKSSGQLLKAVGANFDPFRHTSGAGGDSVYGTGGVGITGNAGGDSGVGKGSGGSGGANGQSQGTARSGGAGAPGIVIVELYA